MSVGSTELTQGAEVPASPAPERGGRTRTAVVTGGGSGIGAGICLRFGADGYAVAVFDLNAAEDTAAAIDADGGTALGLAVDVTDRAAVESAADEVRARLGRPTILVNCPVESAWASSWRSRPSSGTARSRSNLTGAFNCCQVFIPDMLDEAWGRIINISSSSIHSGAPRLAPYVAAKTAIVGLTKCLSLEFAPQGITVNTVPPGFIDTPATRRDRVEGVDQLRGVAEEHAREASRPARRHRQRMFVPGQRAGELHHRSDHPRQRRAYVDRAVTLSRVFEPIRIRGLEVPNRIVRAAHGTALSSPPSLDRRRGLRRATTSPAPGAASA